jgi:hypothetical protein
MIVLLNILWFKGFPGISVKWGKIQGIERCTGGTYMIVNDKSRIARRDTVFQKSPGLHRIYSGYMMKAHSGMPGLSTIADKTFHKFKKVLKGRGRHYGINPLHNSHLRMNGI